MSYSCDNDEKVVSPHSLDHVQLGAGPNHTRKN